MMLASILAGASADPTSITETMLRDTGLFVGTELLNMRAQSLQGRDLHMQVLEELSQSFDDEVKPMVIELQGVQHRLTGTAEAQYAELRSVLRKLVLSERGLSIDDAEGGNLDQAPAR